MIADRLHAADVTAEDVEEIIRLHQRETNELEFKVAADADIVKAACGIANHGGGFILIGVDEDSEHRASAVVDVTDNVRVSDSVRQQLRDCLTPRPVIEVLPLAMKRKNIVVVRVSPQNPPHMVSHEKRTDFYGRYDATTEKMRYEEIEQRFREKFEAGQLVVSETPKAEIETIGGRVSVTIGAREALDQYVDRVGETEGAIFALISVCDRPREALKEEEALTLFHEPLYTRQSGWLVAHPAFDVGRENGSWAQRYGEFSVTTINSSGDFIFLKPVDEVLCWTQDAADFEQSPRFYPNAVVEYCLSYAYSLADIYARTAPAQVLTKVILSKAKGVNLPLGEPGSIWFDAPTESPKRLSAEFRDVAISTKNEYDNPFYARRLAYQLVTVVYSMFGYLERQVPFASDGEITFESSAESATLVSIRAYLQSVLHLTLKPPKMEGFDIYWFNTTYLGKNFRIGATEDFVADHQWSEKKLFGHLDNLKIAAIISKNGVDMFPVITNEGLKLRQRAK